MILNTDSTISNIEHKHINYSNVSKIKKTKSFIYKCAFVEKFHSTWNQLLSNCLPITILIQLNMPALKHHRTFFRGPANSRRFQWIVILR